MSANRPACPVASCQLPEVYVHLHRCITLELA